MSRSLKKLIILMPAIILVAAACNKQAAVQPAQTPTPSPTVDQSASWKTYANNDYRFQLQYPSSWSASDESVTGNHVGVVIVNLNSPGNIAHWKTLKTDPMEVTPGGDDIQISTFKENLSLKDSINAGVKESIYTNAKSITFAGYPAYEMTTIGAGYTIQVFQSSQRIFYEISFHNAKIKADLSSDENQILSTFKFIPVAVQPTPVQPSPVQPSPVPPVNLPSPMVFDATKAKVGDKIGSMTIAAIKGTTTVNFKGSVTIKGTYYPQVSDLASGCAQFRGLDTSSLAKMPRILGDSREVSFCFSSPDSARQKLGSEIKPATVTIDNYIIENLPEVFNSADLISVQ